MADEGLPPRETLKKLGCKRIKEKDGVLSLELPKPKSGREHYRQIAVPVVHLDACVHAFEQITQFNKLPFTIDFEIKHSDQYVGKGLRGMQIRYKVDKELQILCEDQDLNGWIKDGDDYVHNQGLHQGTQPNHIFKPMLPDWLMTMSFDQLYQDKDCVIGTVVDDIKGVKYKMTTGMRDQIFMSGDQSFDQNEISQYFASKYPDKVITQKLQ